MPNKKKPLPASPGEMLPVKTEVEVLRPNQWAGLRGVVETFGGGLHIVRVKYQEKPQTFLVAARAGELLVLSESSEPSNRTDDPPRPS